MLPTYTVLILFILAKKKPKDKLISNAWGRYMIQEDLLNLEIKVQKKPKSQEVEAVSSQDISVCLCVTSLIEVCESGKRRSHRRALIMVKADQVQWSLNSTLKCHSHDNNMIRAL